MSEAQVRNIIEILNKEHNYYKDLLEISKAKKRVIIEGKIAELDKLIRLEQNMIFDIGQLEKTRETVFGSVCLEMGLGKGATISALSKKLEDKLKNELEAAQKHLASVLEELKKVNNLNNELIRQSLEYIDYSVNIITSAGTATSSLYDDLNEKKKNLTIKKRMYDTKV